jgi:hypothetical protein
MHDWPCWECPHRPIVYTGVGSRKTPPNILEFMTKIALKAQSKGYILRSGGAIGADKAFENGAGNLKDIYYANDALPKNNPLANKALEIAAQFHPCFYKCNDYVQRLHARNVFQVMGRFIKEPSQCVVCWTPDGCISHSTRSISTGGTGTAISIAEHFKVPVYNLARKDHLNIFLNWVNS